MNIVFMGTPDFAVPILDRLVSAGRRVTAVVTQPDRPSGRGNKMTPPPVKEKALELGIPVYQFEKLRRQEGLDCLRALAPDIVVTAAFGQILSQKLLDVPKYGTVNVHASLLPKHRGASPINRTIECGDTTAGVTTMLTNAGLDTGDILMSMSTPVLDTDTAGTLSDRLSQMGAELLLKTLDGIEAGTLVPVPQNEDEATYDPMLSRDAAKVDWTRTAKEVSCFIRGMSPWPCAWTNTDKGVLKLYFAQVCDVPEADAAAPGTVVLSSAKAGLAVRCGEDCVRLTQIQAPGSRMMADTAYLAGKEIPCGTRFE